MTTAFTLDPTVQPTKLVSMVPQLDFVFQSRIIFDPALKLGPLGGMGVRLMIPIIGGDFEGSSLHGRILSGGAEWPLIRQDGVGLVDARYTWETDDGVLINVRNTGYRHGPPEVMAKLSAHEMVDPQSYYLRTYSVFEAPDGPYSWLTRHVFIGMAERQPEVLFIRYYILR